MQSLKTKPLLLDISDVTLRIDREEFERLCRNNPDLRLELTANGELVTILGLEYQSKTMQEFALV
jgi:Uma2 family endonuclease